MLRAVSAGAGSRSLVRLAFKSFEMGIPFMKINLEGVDLDPFGEVLFKSHKEKIEQMKDWAQSPFKGMEIVQKKVRMFLC